MLLELIVTILAKLMGYSHTSKLTPPAEVCVHGEREGGEEGEGGTGG